MESDGWLGTFSLIDVLFEWQLRYVAMLIKSAKSQKVDFLALKPSKAQSFGAGLFLEVRKKAGRSADVECACWLEF